MENQIFIDNKNFLNVMGVFENIFNKIQICIIKYIIYYLLLIIFLYLILYKVNDKENLIKYKNFVNNCKNYKLFKREQKKINNENPFISVCLPLYNMEKYIKQALFSIINQSFNNFEIIIVNDNSNDNSENIINSMISINNRIKIYKHNKNLGVFSSRVDAVKKANGEYILLMDPDDMLINPDLFEELYNYNLKYNLDIIEFLVYHQQDKKNKIFFPDSHKLNHYHNFENKIIKQPELSNILFYKPNTLNYSDVICKTVWNKIIRKKVMLKSINYINYFFYNNFLVTADDTPINILNFQFANNYSNIDKPGYLYNIRKNSMSNGKNGYKHDLIKSFNYLLFYILFYRYVKDFKKDLNYLYYDLKSSSFYLYTLKDYKINIYISKAINLFQKIINNKNASYEFKNFTRNMLLYFTE